MIHHDITTSYLMAGVGEAIGGTSCRDESDPLLRARGDVQTEQHRLQQLLEVGCLVRYGEAQQLLRHCAQRDEEHEHAVPL